MSDFKEHQLAEAQRRLVEQFQRGDTLVEEVATLTRQLAEARQTRNIAMVGQHKMRELESRIEAAEREARENICAAINERAGREAAERQIAAVREKWEEFRKRLATDEEIPTNWLEVDSAEKWNGSTIAIGADQEMTLEQRVNELSKRINKLEARVEDRFERLRSKDARIN